MLCFVLLLLKEKFIEALGAIQKAQDVISDKALTLNNRKAELARRAAAQSIRLGADFEEQVAFIFSHAFVVSVCTGSS